MHPAAEIPLAIVGMGCRVPGADDLDSYWRLLTECRSALGDLPAERFDRELYYDPQKGVRTKSYTTLGGYVPHRGFDAVNCPTPGDMHGRTHPVHLNLLEVACAAARQAGYDPFQMPRLTTGVYVGHTPPTSIASRLIHARLAGHTAWYLKDIPGFDELLAGQSEEAIREIVEHFRREFPDRLHPATTLNANAYHASAVVAAALKLDGPAMSYDAACASSMRALAHAARALQLGQIDMAVVGGASYTTADTLILFSQAQSLTSCRSRPFDAEADGLVASEAYAVVFVKTLERALADGDRIQAVIRGIGISSDGKGKSLWAPRREGQIEAVRRAYPQGLSPSRLQYIEAHATSTQLGDATELGALQTAIGDQLPKDRKVIVGSVKGNIGHSLETAGLASIVKTVLAMQHATIPPQFGLTSLNGDVDWNNLPFAVPKTLTPWPEPEAGQLKCAAVNAFGIGGLNVHVILEEHSPAHSQALVRRTPSTPAIARNVAKDGPAPQQEGIAIVGIGAVLPGARTVDALWDLFASGRDVRIEAPSSRWTGGPDRGLGSDRHWQTPTLRGGFITDFEYDWKKHKVPPRQVQFADPLQFMLLDATDQALKDAGYDKRPLDRTRTGVVVGTVFGGEFADQLQMGLRLPEFQKTLREVLVQRGVAPADTEHVAAKFEELLLKRMPALIDETGSFTASTLASRLTKTFDLMGGAVAVDAGDVSSAAAISNCVDLLLAGDCDVMICASGQRNCGFAWFLSMDRNGILAQSELTAPFDASTTGTVPADGIGVVVLKRLSDAQRDGDRIHAVIRGIGAGNLGPLNSSLKLAMQRGLQSARLSPDQVSVIEAAAHGVPDADREELKTILEGYGTSTRRSELLIGAVAGQIGHACGASGMMSLLKAVSELNHAEMPKNVGLAQPISELQKASRVFRAPLRAEKLKGINDDGRVFAAVNCHSLANGAFHILLEGGVRVPAETPIAPAQADVFPAPPVPVSFARRSVIAGGAPSWKIVRQSATNLNDILAAAAQWTEAAAAATAFAAGASLNELCDPASQLSGYHPGDRCRLAIVARSPEELMELAGLAVKQLSKAEARGPLAEKGVFYGELSAARPRIAFLFPGQGSQYAGMLKSLTESFTPAAEAVHEVDAILSRLALPSFADIAWNDGDKLGSDVWRTQMSLLAADMIVYRAARAIGLKPERVGGHSFGELVALTAASAWTFEDAVRATSARCASIDACRNAKGALLSTSAAADVAEKACQEIGRPELGHRVYVSHRNSPDQSVIGGDPEAVARVSERLSAAGFRTKILDVPAAFHTPLMEEVKGPFGKALAAIPMEPPTIPLLSSVTNRYVSDPEEIRQNLVIQMTQPVYWVELVQRLYREGMNVLVEVGPKQILTGLQKQTLAGLPVTIVGCDHPKRDGLQQLLFARAAVEVTGALDSAAAWTVPAQQSTPSNAVSPEMASPAPQAPPPAVVAADSRQSAAPVIETIGGARILRLSGTPYEMGLQHGRAESESIRRTLRRHADLAGTRWDRLTDMEAASREPEVFFGPEELEELRGIAEGADVALPSLVAHNLRMYLDVGAGGLHFAIRSAHNPEIGLLHGANEDLQRGLSVRDCLQRNIQIRTPAHGRPHIAFCVAGQVGTLNGANSSGLTVTTSALADVSLAEPGRAWLQTVLVKRLLEYAQDVDSAVLLLRQQKSSGAWTLCLSHDASDRLCYVEFDGKELKVQQSPDSVFASNHRLMRAYRAAEGSQAAGIPNHSRLRLDRLRQLLGAESPSSISLEKARSALRDRFDPSRGRESEYPTINTLRRVDNQISVLFEPKQKRIWVTAGPLSNGHQNDFECLDLARLLPGFGERAASAPSSKAESVTSSPASLISRRDLSVAYGNASTRDRHGDVCSRSVVRVTASPLPVNPDSTRTMSGPFLVFGANPVAQAIVTALQKNSVDVAALVPAPDSTIDSLQTQFDQLTAARPIPHLIIATSFDADAQTRFESSQWSARRNRGVMTPFFVAQKWMQHVSETGALNQASVTAVTSMGGDFGLSGRFEAVEGGGLSGLVKGLEMEVRMSRGAPQFRGRIVDFNASAFPQTIAELLLQELAADDGENEIGYLDGRRHAVRPVPAPIDVPATSAVPRGAVFVVTGGARGVTAVVARELGKRFGARLHLLGASPKPEIPEAWRNLGEAELKDVKATIMKEALANGQKPADAWSRFEKALEIDQTLRTFADAGVQATYHACDVGNRAILASVLETIRRTDGPIQGVLHGAGFERACKFEKKQRDLVDKTISAKVDGAANLMELTQNDPVKWFVGFGSVSGRFGGVGQADYCVANEMLAKLIDWYRVKRPTCAAAVFHWHAWDDVGMAVRPESQHIRKLHKINFMPSLEGARHLLDELHAGLPEPEIVISEVEYAVQRYGASLHDAGGAGGSDVVDTEETAAAGTADLSLPLIDRVVHLEPGRRVLAEIDLDPTRDVFLAQHLFKGRPLMPVVASIEAIVEAASRLAAGGENVRCVRDIEILAGLKFPSDKPQVGRIQGDRTGDTIAMTLSGDLCNRRGQILIKDKPYLRASVDVSRGAASFDHVFPRIESEWSEVWYPETDTVIWHGAPLRRLQKMSIIDDRHSGGLLLAPHPGELSGATRARNWLTPAALLDSCLFACGIVFWFHHKGVVAIPDGIQSIEFGRMPRAGERCTVIITNHGRQGMNALFDFVLFGEDESVVLSVTGYRNVIVAEEPAHAV